MPAWDSAGRTETDLHEGDAEMEEKFVIVFLCVFILLCRFLGVCVNVCALDLALLFRWIMSESVSVPFKRSRGQICQRFSQHIAVTVLMCLIASVCNSSALICVTPSL